MREKKNQQGGMEQEEEKSAVFWSIGKGMREKERNGERGREEGREGGRERTKWHECFYIVSE